MNQRGASIVGVGVVAAVAGVLLGFGVAALLAPKAQPGSSVTEVTAPDSATKAADLRVKLDDLLQEHAYLAAGTSAATVAGLPESTALTTQLSKNSSDLAAALGGYYGAANQQKFLDGWQAHVKGLSDYATAVRKGDQAGMTAAKQTMDSQVQAVAVLLASFNNRFAANDIKTMLAGHEAGLTAAIDSYDANDYTAAVSGVHSASQHAIELGNYLANGTVKQYPGKF